MTVWLELQVVTNFTRIMMVMFRLNVPSVFLYGGSIFPGVHNKEATVQDVFEAVGSLILKRFLKRTM